MGEKISPLLTGLLVASTGWLLVGTVVKAIQSFCKDKAVAQKRSPIDLIGCFYPVYEILLAVHLRSHPSSEAGFLMTIYSVDQDSGKLEQCIDFVGATNAFGRAGHTSGLSLRIAGVAARKREPFLFAIEANADKDLVNSAMQEWFSAEDRWKRIPVGDRGVSTMAVPILGGASRALTQSIGVLVALSTDPKFFTEEIQQLVLDATAGMAEFIRLRYPS
jgi:hypothetical protein